MEHVLELMYEGACVWIFCLGVALMMYCFGEMDQQYQFVKANIYEQHMMDGSFID